MNFRGCQRELHKFNLCGDVAHWSYRGEILPVRCPVTKKIMPFSFRFHAPIVTDIIDQESN